MNSILNINKISVFGESHSRYMGVSIDNVPCGIKLDLDKIKKLLVLRQGTNLSTNRKEEDLFVIASGVDGDYTNGNVLTFLIENKNYKSSDYSSDLLRPSTSDYVVYNKYQGFNKNSGSSFFSARLTALYVIAGEVSRQILNNDILVSSHISNVYDIKDTSFDSIEEQRDLMLRLNTEALPLINKDNYNKIEELLTNTNSNYGSSIETKIIGLDKLYLGEATFYKFDALLSYLIFNMPAVKALEFGIGTSYQNQTEKVNDLDTNNEGGINAGITNGKAVIFKTTFRPIATTKNPQDYLTKSGEYVSSTYQGRHDRVAALRASTIINALAYIVILELYYYRNRGGFNG